MFLIISQLRESRSSFKYASKISCMLISHLIVHSLRILSIYVSIEIIDGSTAVAIEIIS